jgi:hypothetical protein
VRILLDLEALNDHKVWDASEYHKVQGFVYDKLIATDDGFVCLFAGDQSAIKFLNTKFASALPLSGIHGSIVLL